MVDRLQIAQYPSGVGELELHSDPFENQKMAISGIMSKRGKDYKTGGAYILNSNKEKIVWRPEKWFGQAMVDNNIQDLCPEEWIKIH